MPKFRNIVTAPWRGIRSIFERAPWISFFVILALLFGAIALGQTLRTPAPLPEKEPVPPKAVEVFIPGRDSARVTVPAQVEKGSSTRITALMPGIVSHIWVRPGQKIGAGRTLFTLTNDYGSGRAEIEKEIARNDAKLAEKVADIDKGIQKLQDRRIKEDPLLTPTERELALETVEKERAIRKATLKESRLNLELALRNDAVLRPKSSLPGVVTHIAVRRGQFVNAGETLATLTAPGETSTLEATLTSETIWLLDGGKPARLTVQSETFELTPLYYSRHENEVGLYTAVFSLPENVAEKLTDKRYVDLVLPLVSQDQAYLLPLDTLFQDNQRTWVMVEEDGHAKPREVTLGEIIGNYAEVTSGLSSDTRVILTRGLIEGEAVTLK